MVLSNKKRIEASEILSQYSGKNSHINYLKSKSNLNDMDLEYILMNHMKTEPIIIDRVIKISDYYGKELQKRYNISFTPQKVMVKTLSGETDMIYHCWVKWSQNQDKWVSLFIPKRAVLDVMIKVDWENYPVDVERLNKMLEKSGREIMPHQVDAIKFLNANKKCILADEMGLGKEQPNSLQIPTPNGYKSIGEIKQNDEVFGKDGKIYNVIKTHPQGKKKVYKIFFSDGTTSECGLEHLWLVRNNWYRDKNTWIIKSTGDIIESGITQKTDLIKRKLNKKIPIWEIPLCEPAEFHTKSYLIPPYLIGLLLGDGGLSGSHITLSINENEFIYQKEKIDQMIISDYKWHTQPSKKNCYFLSLTKKNSKPKVENIYKTEIKRLGINVKSNEKFIPQEYMIGNVNQRLELLRGLMDADGNIAKTGNRISFKNNSQILCENICELIRSLGGVSKIHKYHRNTKHSIGGRVVNTQPHYFIVTFKLNKCPFSLPDKVKHFNPSRNHYCTAKKIENIVFDRIEECTCLSVNSPDNTYLTNNFIVTHNTTSLISASINGNFNKILIICPASVKSTWKKEISFFGIDNVGIIQGTDREQYDMSKKYVIVNPDIINKHLHEVVYTTIIDKFSGKPKKVKSKNKAKIGEVNAQNPLINANFDLVIIDECHKFSNATAGRYKAIIDFLHRSNIEHIYTSSGSPISNSHVNFFNILNLIGNELGKNYEYYYTRYCGARTMKLKTGKEILKPNADTNGSELYDKCKHIYLRRLKSEIPGLPERTIIERFYDLTDKQRKEYEKLWEEYEEAKAEEGKNISELNKELVSGGIYRQYLAKQMIPHTIELAESWLESEKKIIIGCCFNEELDIIREHFGDKCVVYHGSMTAKQKDKAQEEFTYNPDCKVFVGNILASGVGLTLTSSNILIVNSFDFVPSNLIQFIDRNFRVGQKEHVYTYIQIFNDTYCEHVYNKVIKKTLVINTIIKDENEKT